ncbi:MAG: SEC-C domain-containing protein [Bryobacterales bacterium]|nr:SEC-C domain-containing protein [Bryobacterales bacterium]
MRQFLAPKQVRVIEGILAGLTVTAAAEAAGVHRTTVHHWCRVIPEFRNTLDAVKQARIDSIQDAMQALVAPSIAILTSIVHDESQPLSLRMRTAMAILKFASTPAKVPVAKDAMGHVDYAAATACSDTPQDEIHRHSSPSSNGEPVESPAASTPPQTPRNASCPCGSGDKYKRCCGKNAPPVLSRAA